MAPHRAGPPPAHAAIAVGSKCVVALVVACALAVARAAPNPPNFLFILSDDLGFGEVSWTPGRSNFNISTPNIDGIAAAGIAFTDAYTGSPVCAPSRGSLLTRCVCVCMCSW